MRRGDSRLSTALLGHVRSTPLPSQRAHPPPEHRYTHSPITATPTTRAPPHLPPDHRHTHHPSTTTRTARSPLHAQPDHRHSRRPITTHPPPEHRHTHSPSTTRTATRAPPQPPPEHHTPTYRLPPHVLPLAGDPTLSAHGSQRKRSRDTTECDHRTGSLYRPKLSAEHRNDAAGVTYFSEQICDASNDMHDA